jgi:hypothetical protein
VIHRVRLHGQYANVMATIAVFIAVGGTSYAAIALPPNSVGGRELKPKAVGASDIRSNAVRSRAIRDGAVRPRDLAKSTKSRLTGPPGPAGPPGAAAVQLRAAFDSTGGMVSGNAAGAGGAGTGKRLVSFGRSLAGCIPFAALAKNAGGPVVDPGAGRIVVAIEDDQVAVETYDASGARQFLPFNVIVSC